MRFLLSKYEVILQFCAYFTIIFPQKQTLDIHQDMTDREFQLYFGAVPRSHSKNIYLSR